MRITKLLVKYRTGCGQIRRLKFLLNVSVTITINTLGTPCTPEHTR